ncbi:MAG TPA: acetylornithine transaminase [Polyangiaceae bacterium]|nr:acetylornithine transaminase [Polyangiaceae bacterium]
MSKETQDALVALGQRYLYPNYRQPGLVMQSGKGALLWDVAGKRYLDFYGGIAVSALGHAHPALIAALSEQAARLIHVSNYFYNETNVRLAEKLCKATGFDRVFFANSGTEAIEACLKLARRHFFMKGEPERLRVLAFHNSFHGRTLGALAATGQDKYKEGFGTLPHTVHVPYGDLSAVKAAMGRDVAAILVEPIQGEGGVSPAPAGFLRELRRIADETGALLIADEVQTGIGRTGKMLGIEHDDVRPDVVALAKGLGGGVPIGAMLCREALKDALPPGSHGSTFGGNALASAAALAVLETIERDQLLVRTAAVGEYLAQGLLAVSREFPALVETSRGRGLLQALVLRGNVDARAVLQKLWDAGLLLTIAGGQALRFSPPLIVSDAEIDEALAVIRRVFASLSPSAAETGR